MLISYRYSTLGCRLVKFNIQSVVNQYVMLNYTTHKSIQTANYF